MTTGNSKERAFLTARGPLALPGRPLIVGILNVTPDSFSDGGRFLDPARAVEHGLRMEAEGADILDIGGCSTRPGAAPVDPAEEIARVIPVVRALASAVRVPISIDTFRADVFERAVDLGAAILNDVTALRGDPRLAGVAQKTRAGVVLMHMAGEPQTMQDAPRYTDVVREVIDFLAVADARACAAGIDGRSIALDPGIGFGKTAAHNLEILGRAAEFHVLGRPLFWGVSRKSFLGKVLERPDPARREWASLAVACRLAAEGAAFVRVHDVAATRDALRILEAIDGRTFESQR